MKCIKRFLPLLLILAMLLPMVATVGACPACPGWVGDHWPLPITLYFRQPYATVEYDVLEGQRVLFPNVKEEFIGYDFIGWYPSPMKMEFEYSRWSLCEADDYHQVQCTDAYFYALFGKISEDGYDYYTTEIDFVPPFSIGHTLSLENGISANFLIKKEDLAQYDDVIVTATMPDSSGKKTNQVKSVGCTRSDCGEYQRYTVKAVDATKMNDEITFKMKLVQDGKVAYVEESYSIADYAYSQLNKENASDSLKALCANLLQYGGWAQRYKGYRTDACADSLLTEAQRGYLTDLNSVAFETVNETMNDLQEPSVLWVGKTLDLQSNVTLKTYIDCTHYTGAPEDLQLKVRYTDSHGNEQIAYGDMCTPYDGEKQQFTLSFAGLPATDLRTSLELCVVDPAGTQVSATMRYSIGSYGNGKTNTLLSLCQALMAYSDSAVAFKNS